MIACAPSDRALSSNQSGGVTAETIGTVNQQEVTLIHPDIVVVNQIAGFMADAVKIQNAFVADNDVTAIKNAEQAWGQKVTLYLGTKLDLSYAVQFANAHGNAMMGSLVGHSADGDDCYNDIQAKKDMLAEILGELRHARP
jgi:hypothetical protein